MYRNQYLIDMCIIEGCAVLDDSCTECGTPEDWEQAMTQQLEGRQLDASVAARCLGLQVRKSSVSGYGGYAAKTGLFWSPLSHYGKNMDDAWQVAEWIRANSTGGFVLHYDSDDEPGRWECICWIWVGNSIQAVSATADKPSEAICHAALKLADQLEQV